MGVYKKNPSTPDLHINCNLTSDNMPKIHPETKVADYQEAEHQIHCWGGRHLQCVSASSTEDKKNIWRDWRRFWQAQVRQTLQDNRSGGPFVGSKIQGQPLFHCSRAPRDLVTWSPRVNQNSLSNSVSKWPPWSNQCPETSTEQKTIKKLCGFCQGPQPAKRMDAGQVAVERWISQMNLLLNYITVAANIAGDLLEPTWSWDLPRKKSSLVVEKSWSGITFSMGGVREICRVEGNINSLKYQEVLAASYIPNHKRGQILQQDGAPSHTSISTSTSSSRRRRSRCSRIGQPSHQTWTSLSMSGVGWKRKHGRWNQRILMNSGRHARLLSLLFLMTSSINCMNPCRTAWMQSFKLMEDIKFGSHSTTT